MDTERVATAIAKIVSNKLGLPEYKVKEALGIPIEDFQAATIEEAKKAHYSRWNNPEIRRSAFLKWDKLSLQAAKEASTLEGLVLVFLDAPENGEAEIFIIKALFDFIKGGTRKRPADEKQNEFELTSKGN